MPELSDDERKHMIGVMERAKEFEDEESVSWKRNMTEGLLYKYTNVMKGFQHRWFVLDADTSCLYYYEKIEHRKQKPRGVICLSGAVVSPSDEDAHQFTVNAPNGEIFRLKTQNSKERQFWVDKIRSCIQYKAPLVGVESVSMPSLNHTQSDVNNLKHVESLSSQELNIDYKHFDETADNEINLKQCKNSIGDIKKQYLDLDACIASSELIDNEILLLKAISYAALSSLENCLSIIKDNTKTMEKNLIKNKLPSITTENLPDFNSTAELKVNHDNELEDIKDDSFDSTSTKSLDDDHKSVILGVLTQLKLGMDLTKVSLPSFILEPRSLLEMFADCMAHPSMFLQITTSSSPEERMTAVVEWYLACFHAVRNDSVAKKPYNPIIGEMFHCSWKDQETDERNLYCCAEQVSHHPPVSAFYVESPNKNIYLNGSVWTKSKFLGMSIGVQLVGKVQIHILDYAEHYDLTLPSIYARSILTKPWVELGDKVTITCPQTSYSTSICFQTKPFYGGKLNKVTGEIRDNQNSVVCKISGEWNSSIELHNIASGETKVINIESLTTASKLVRPVEEMNAMESQRLWADVTEALTKGSIDEATACKRILEEKQRNQEKYRKQNDLEHNTRYFHKIEDGFWEFNKPLVKEQTQPSF